MKVERSMSCAEIGEELGISRQAVSQSLKRALIKIYNRLVSLEETEKSP
jgi:predicted DNA binding protein